ncbi:cation:proton antiporter [Lacimicrobium alkaliphilum]|uniref:Potassium transporter n=1 Tax=Lacimicrobium alkaliphilum TaxID=1526571 RepID=A0ABQ1RSC6_9ALTE|nr:cation:proton antiporter [Lacimicrobium alkaliphilum]GGD78832.1 potassium transporter [Lacimicrobium alkaliphilum]
MPISSLLITVGGLLLAGLAVEGIGRHTPLPRVTLLLAFGFVIGPSGIDVLPDIQQTWFPVIANIALLMIGFLLGEKLVRLLTGRLGDTILKVSIYNVVITVVVVLAGLWLFDVPLIMALLLAAIASATAPAATTDVIEEARAKGPFTSVLTGVVAIDDAWGMIIFSILLAWALVLGGDGNGLHGLWLGVQDVGGAMLLGTLLGAPMAYLTGRIRPGQPTMVEALGFVFLCGGLAEWFGVSFLLASMVMGSVVYALAGHHKRPFHEIEYIDWPFKILFFILAGAALHIPALFNAGAMVIGYILLRIVGKIAGAIIGGRLSGADPVVSRWLGPALLPQAGVAIGMALLASQQFPQLAEDILAVAIGATVFFELVGPVFTRLALRRAGEDTQMSQRHPKRKQ